MSGQARRRSEQRRVRRPAILVLGAAVIAAAAISAGLLGLLRSGGEDELNAQLAAIGAGRLDAIGSGGLADPLRRTTGTDVLRGPSGKPLVLYVGNEACGACAAERWSLVLALSRFGTLSGIERVRSADDEAFAGTASVSFRRASYVSELIDFDAVETADRNHRPLETPTVAQNGSVRRFDPEGLLPYVSVADRLVQVGSGFPPDVLAGLDWAAIVTALDADGSLAQAVLGNANYLTAAICDVTANQPAHVCDSPSVRDLARNR